MAVEVATPRPRGRRPRGDADVIAAIEMVRAGMAVRVTLANLVGLELSASRLVELARSAGVTMRLVRSSDGRATGAVVDSGRG